MLRDWSIAAKTMIITFIGSIEQVWKHRSFIKNLYSQTTTRSGYKIKCQFQTFFIAQPRRAATTKRFVCLQVKRQFANLPVKFAITSTKQAASRFIIRCSHQTCKIAVLNLIRSLVWLRRHKPCQLKDSHAKQNFYDRTDDVKAAQKARKFWNSFSHMFLHCSTVLRKLNLPRGKENSFMPRIWFFRSSFEGKNLAQRRFPANHVANIEINWWCFSGTASPRLITSRTSTLRRHHRSWMKSFDRTFRQQNENFRR